MKPESRVQENQRPWLALLAAVCLLLAIPVARLAAMWFAPAGDLLGYGGLAAAIAGLCVSLLAGVVLAILSLLRREAPRLLPVMVLLVASIALVWLFLHKPG